MIVLAFVLGALLGVLVTIACNAMIDRYLPDDESQRMVDFSGMLECPPCNHRCRQGRDCPNK